MSKKITVTEFQWTQIQKALDKRRQYLRQHIRRYGQDNDTLEKIIAIEAIYEEWNNATDIREKDETV